MESPDSQTRAELIPHHISALSVILKHPLDPFYRDPRATIERLCNTPVDPDELEAIVDYARRSETVGREGGVGLFIKLIIDGYERKGDAAVNDTPCAWETPLLGLARCLEGPTDLLYDADELDEEELERVRGSYRAIVDVVHRDIPYLLPPGSEGESRREAVGKFLLACKEEVPGLEAIMLYPKTLALAMHGYIYSSRETRKLFTRLMAALFDGATEAVLESAVHSVGPAVLASKFRETLTDPELVNEGLQSELEAIFPLFNCTNEFTNVFVHAKTYEHIMAALVRQKEEGSYSWNLPVYALGDELLNNIGKGLPTATTVYIQMIKSGFLDFVGEVTCLMAEDDDTDLPKTLVLVGHIPHDCRNSECNLRPHPRYKRTCRTALPRTYFPTLARLQAARTAAAQRSIRMWALFAKEAGVTEKECWKATPRAKVCGNASCPAKSVEKKEMKVCEVCRGRYYCSAGCMKLDKKFHKSLCPPPK